jgi:hypothetical protein
MTSAFEQTRGETSTNHDDDISNLQSGGSCLLLRFIGGGSFSIALPLHFSSCSGSPATLFLGSSSLSSITSAFEQTRGEK